MATTNSRILARLLRLYGPSDSQRCLSHLIDKSQLARETVMTKKNRESCVKNLKLSPSTKINDEAKIAAVLVPMCTYRGELGLLYTLRSTKLNSDKGHVSFPGGMKEDADGDLIKTALRETWEELKIPETNVDVWTTANLIGRKNLSVTPVFGYIGEINPEKLEINPQEVEEAFVISLKILCDPNYFRYTQFRNGFVLPAYVGGKYRVWGLTAAITHIIMKALLPEVYKNELKVLKPVGRPTWNDKIENKNLTT